MIMRIFIGVLLVACSWTQAQAAQQYVFEKADVLTRPKASDPFDVEHAGLYLSSNSEYRGWVLPQRLGVWRHAPHRRCPPLTDGTG
jgi:hypothetical protein